MDRETMKNKTEAQVIERAAETRLVHLPENQISINDHVYTILTDYRNAFDDLKIKARFSEILIKYDYIVGDIAADQLRLKGFYSIDRTNVNANQTIATLEDYLFEYVNFGAPYFVLQNMNPKIVTTRREPVTNRTKKRNKRPSSTNSNRNEKINRETNNKQINTRKKSQASRKNQTKVGDETTKRTNNRNRNNHRNQNRAEVKEVRKEVGGIKQNGNNGVAVTNKKNNHHKRHFTIKQKED